MLDQQRQQPIAGLDVFRVRPPLTGCSLPLGRILRPGSDRVGTDLGVGVIMRHHNCLGDVIGLNLIGQFLNKVPDQGLRIGRVQPYAATPLLGEPIVVPGEMLLRPHRFLGPVAARGIEVYFAEHLADEKEMDRRRVPLDFTGEPRLLRRLALDAGQRSDRIDRVGIFRGSVVAAIVFT